MVSREFHLIYELFEEEDDASFFFLESRERFFQLIVNKSVDSSDNTLFRTVF